MAQQPDLAAILAALGQGGTPVQNSSTPQPPAPAVYPSAATPANPLAGVALPQPTNSGSLDLSSIKPVNSGSVSLADAIAKARGIAAERATSRDDSRRGGYGRSRSRSPPRREPFRDNHNPFRDERRDDPRRGANGRDRSVSPPTNNSTFSPPRTSQTRARSPPNSKASSNSEVITIESSTVGLVIGRGGENLRRVEAETGARVQFITGPESGPKRQCRISGTPRQRADAIRDIYRVIEEHPVTAPEKPASQGYGYGAPAKSVTPSDPPLREGEKSSQIMVPDRTVGLIIGRGGETIRDIQERSGCHVNIVGESKSVNGLRPVNLIGTPQAAEDAKRMIQEVVDSDTRAGPPAPAAVPQYPPQMRQPPYGAAPAPQYGMPYDPYGGAAAPAPYADPAASAKVTDTIIVPSEAVGMIIGKGGETIKEMQSVTGCKINVSPPSGPDINREIGLIGARPAIEQAKKAIWDKVNAVREKQGGVWTRGPEVTQSYGGDPYSHQPQPYAQAPIPQATPVQAAEDPYAAYGGYANYCALWAAATANMPPTQ